MAQIFLENKGMETIFDNHGGCEKSFFYLEKASTDMRKKYIKPSSLFIGEFNDYLVTLKKLSD